MKISELIEVLQYVQSQHGDLEVVKMDDSTAISVASIGTNNRLRNKPSKMADASTKPINVGELVAVVRSF